VETKLIQSCQTLKLRSLFVIYFQLFQQSKRFRKNQTHQNFTFVKLSRAILSSWADKKQFCFELLELKNWTQLRRRCYCLRLTAAWLQQRIKIENIQHSNIKNIKFYLKKIKYFFVTDPEYMKTGATPRGDWGKQSPLLLTKVIFVNRLKPLRIYRGYGRWRHQPYLNFRLSLSQVVFKDQI